jgi:low temperature requirement protein LtrA
MGALALDFAGPALIGRGRGWRVQPAHFAERHALIMIIALGESIVAIGVGATSELDLGVVVAASVGIAVVSALWWLYFDVAAILARRQLSSARGVAQARMARDAYSYLHWPMVAGIVLFALALKKTIGDVGEPLGTVPAVGLFGGLALYLIGHCGFLLRTTRHLFRRRLLTGVVLLALLPVVGDLPALASLSTAAAACAAVVAFEAIRHREHRAEVRRAELAV